MEIKCELIALAASDGLQLVGELWGPKGGAPIIFLHGGGQSRAAWRGAARRLGQAGYRACTMDLRGHGESGWSEALDYGFRDFVGDLVALIDTLAAGPAIVVGASLGGHIAMLAAAWHPDKFKLLLLADVTPWVDETLADGMRATLREAGLGFATVEEAGAMVARLRGTPPRTTGGSEGLRPHLRQGTDGRFYFPWDVRLMDDEKLRGGGKGGLFQREATRLRLPILVMRAEQSTITSPGQVEAFRAVQPDLQEVVIKGADHMVTGDVNDTYALAIFDFLTSLGVGHRPDGHAHPPVQDLEA